MRWIFCILANAVILFSICKLLPTARTLFDGWTRPTATTKEIDPKNNFRTEQTPRDSFTSTQRTEFHPTSNSPTDQPPLHSITPTLATELNPTSNSFTEETSINNVTPVSTTEFQPTSNLPTDETSLNSITSTSTTELSPKINQKSPIILVPGFGGSRLEDKLNKSTGRWYCFNKTPDFEHLWIDCRTVVFNRECLMDNMELSYDNETKTTRNPEGVEIRVPGWGDPSSVENPECSIRSGYFLDINKMLVNELEYIREVSLRAAPYDFRKGPNENQDYFRELKDLIEETYEMNNNQSVTLLAHSMGGPMSLVFLQSQTQAWKDKYINSLITLAASWGGSSRALQAVVMGDDLDIPLAKLKFFDRLLKTFPSLGWLLPSKIFWENDVLVETQSMNYTAANLQEYLIEVGIPNVWEFKKNNEKYLQDFNPPGVELHCLYGSNVDTIEKLLYAEGKSIRDDPTFVKGDGDRSVNLRSLEGCKRWIGKQNQTIHIRAFPGVTHLGILDDDDVLDYLKEVLKPRL